MILLQTQWATFTGLGFRSSSKELQRKALCEAVASCPCFAALREEVPSEFLQRDRIDIVTLNISKITSRSTHERSQIVSPGKTEKRCLMVNMTEDI